MLDQKVAAVSRPEIQPELEIIELQPRGEEESEVRFYDPRAPKNGMDDNEIVDYFSLMKLHRVTRL